MKSRRHTASPSVLLISLSLSLFLWAIPSHAQSIHLLIPGIPGESTSSNHKDEIVLSSFSFGLSVSNSLTGGGGGISKPTFSEIHLNKILDRSTPKLIEFAATSKNIAKATITVTANTEGRSSDFYTIELNDVTVTSYTNSGSEGSRPFDSFSLAYRKAVITYKYFDNTGALKDTLMTTLTPSR